MNSRTTIHPTYEELAKAWREGYAAGWKDQECDFPPHTTENPYKEQHMDNVNHPKHYEVLATCDTSQRIIKTFEPRKSK